MRFYSTDQSRNPKGLSVLLPHSVLFKIKVVHWELASEWWLLLSLEVFGGIRKPGDCFLSSVTFDKGPLLPVYSMETETWDKMKVT